MLHFEGEDLKRSQPSDIGQSEDSSGYTSGVWMLVNMDLSLLVNKPQRLKVSLLGYVIKRMGEYATKDHLTRRALIAKARESLIVSQKGWPALPYG